MNQNNVLRKTIVKRVIRITNVIFASLGLLGATVIGNNICVVPRVRLELELNEVPPTNPVVTAALFNNGR